VRSTASPTGARARPGLGRPLRSTLPAAPETPILVAALGPRNAALAAEIADGLLPYLWSPSHWHRAWGEALAAAPDGFHVAPTVVAALGDDLAACRDEVRQCPIDTLIVEPTRDDAIVTLAELW
jgi:alkanesulfonate monooxygenase SsuD/methylene tetrahydromethanopterin reductase-like flavin-dependent oxidoreductase (luciferase family)